MSENVDNLFLSFVNSTHSGGRNGLKVNFEQLDRALLELPSELSDKIYPWWEKELESVLQDYIPENRKNKDFVPRYTPLLLEILKRGMKRNEIAEALMRDKTLCKDEYYLAIAEYVPKYAEKALALVRDEREKIYFLLRKAIRESGEFTKPSLKERLLEKGEEVKAKVSN